MRPAGRRQSEQFAAWGRGETPRAQPTAATRADMPGALPARRAPHLSEFLADATDVHGRSNSHPNHKGQYDGPADRPKEGGRTVVPVVDEEQKPEQDIDAFGDPEDDDAVGSRKGPTKR